MEDILDSANVNETCRRQCSRKRVQPLQKRKKSFFGFSKKVYNVKNVTT